MATFAAMLHLLEKIAPNFLAKKAYTVLTNPQTRKLRTHEQKAIASARRSSMSFRGFTIQRYTWGFGPKHALLVHGWEGRAGNFAALIPILVDAGYTVHAFDAPAHGESTVATTSLYDYSALTEEILRSKRFETVITHSFGSVPASLALSNLAPYPLNRLLMITSPNRFEDRLTQVLEQMKLTAKTGDRVIELFKKETGEDPRSLSVEHFCLSIKANKSLVVHGENDLVLPREWSERVAEVLPNGSFEIIPDTGHYRILYNGDMQERLQQFLANENEQSERAN